MKRIIRDQRLTPEEAAKYKAVREQVAQELPELIARHQERTAALDELDDPANFRDVRFFREPFHRSPRLNGQQVNELSI